MLKKLKYFVYISPHTVTSLDKDIDQIYDDKMNSL